jgi:hypothetical protein
MFIRRTGYLIVSSAAAVLLLSLPTAHAADSVYPSGMAYEYDPKLDADKKWKESAHAIPPLPAEQDLVPVPLPKRDTLKLFIDTKSVTRADDGTLRLTLVVQSSSGLRNVFYEVYRCETREFKTLAAGTIDSALTPIKKPVWEKPPFFQVNAYRFTLFKHYLCTAMDAARSPAELIRRIRHPSVAEIEAYEFQ